VGAFKRLATAEGITGDRRSEGRMPEGMAVALSGSRVVPGRQGVVLGDPRLPVPSGEFTLGVQCSGGMASPRGSATGRRWHLRHRVRV